tara:strand:+ start:6901 stop:9456 length:2556 start_codon:yes stop_codon:yes gene_type:complete
MFAMYDKRFRDLLLLFLGFFGAIWFFFDLGNHHPVNSLKLPLSDTEIIQRADSVFLSWQYQPVNLKKRALVKSYGRLIDDLQEKWDPDSVVAQLKARNGHTLPLYFWEVEEFRIDDKQRETMFKYHMSGDGRVISFSVDDKLIAEQTPFNRQMVRYGYLGGRNIPRQYEDSLIAALVDFQHLRTENSRFYNITGDDVASERQTKAIWRGIEYYLKGTYWKDFDLSQDSLEYNDDGTVRYVTAFMSSGDTLMGGVVPKLQMDVLAAGVIRNLKVDLGEESARQDMRFGVRSNILLGATFMFIVWILFSFYLRIKARSVDTRPALIVAIISGFMMPILRMLEITKSLGVNPELNEISEVFNGLMAFSVMGAAVATGFFVVTAVSDSVTRQYWPDQMRNWDLVRRGMFKNKPIGWAIIRGISIGAFLAGFMVFLINFVPVYISGKVSFAEDVYSLAPIANIIVTLLLGVGFVAVAFLVLGNQLYAKTSKKWLVPLISAALFALVDPLPMDIVTDPWLIYMNLIIGFLFGMFYITFDFVTVALGFVIFLNFFSTAPGWLVSGSPDATLFYGFIITLLLLAGSALYFLIVGEEKDKLPEYVPEYIEDLAKEQRVKQELDIARSVQITFLPNTTPDVPGFDTAASCEPAQDTGGDYYDIICLDDKKAAVAIGDVSGKGIQAAFYMTFAKGVIHSLSGIFPSPKTLLYRTNKLFNENATRGTFISMIYGVLDSEKRTFTYVRAGHNPILYKKANGEINWLQPKGVAVGMTKGEIFNKVVEEDTIQLEKGDILVLYTDGITEAQNENEEFYDERRLKNIVKRVKTKSAEDLRSIIIEDVRTFMGDALQYDDMTLVVIKA